MKEEDNNSKKDAPQKPWVKAWGKKKKEKKGDIIPTKKNKVSRQFLENVQLL